ncbi:MAG: DUF354 domain-containing protein [Halobacteriota archaeon]
MTPGNLTEETATEHRNRSNGSTGAPVAWVDLASPSHPFFFAALIDALSDLETRTTVREKTETVPLAETAGFDFEVRGRDFDNTLLRKVGIPLRTAQLTLQMPAADLSLSSRNAMCILASKARGIPSIHFTDNDITAHVSGLAAEELYNRFEAQATYNVVPAAFETHELRKHGAHPDSIVTYDGYKEDLYVADFEPDPTFTTRLPFEEYVVVRPEALGAAYVDEERSLVPDIVEGAVDAGLNVVYLPRRESDRSHAMGFPADRVHVPTQAYDGLQLVWHADCVLTGSGTLAREAACMGKPAVSFFPNALLSVDSELVAADRVFHSRNAEDIVAYLTGLDASDSDPDRTRARRVREEIVAVTNILVDCVR